MEEIISSNKNDKIKYLKKLYKSSKRKKEGKFILEGYRLIKQAYESGATIDYIFVNPSFKKSKEYQTFIFNKGLTGFTYLIEDKLLKDVADTVNPQGIVAIVSEIDYKLSSIIENGKKIVVLDRIQDPGNMGTIIRTAAAAGMDGVISLKGSVDIYNLKVLRATAGAIFNIPFINKLSYDKFSELLSNKLRKYQLICTSLDTENYYHNVNYNENNILIIGNEANGIRKNLLKNADLTVKIPLNNSIESINAAMAAGLLMYKIQYD